MFKKFVFATVACAGLAAAAVANNPRASTSQKGSLLIFPHVEVRLDAAGTLTTDTFIQISNDNNDDVHVVGFFVADANLTDPNSLIRDISGCRKLYTDFNLTEFQPRYWAASSGKSQSGQLVVAPVTAVPGGLSVDPVTGEQYATGYYFVFATNNQNRPIRWNHLSGLATVVDYANGDAWEYSPYAFQVVKSVGPDLLVDPNNSGSYQALNLNGSDYEYSFNTLLAEFIASGAMSFTGGGVTVDHDTQITLMINTIDVRQDYDKYVTKAKYLYWNQDETSFSYEYCVYCWRSDLLSSFGQVFATNLGENFHAQINGEASTVCNYLENLNSSNQALLGTIAKVMTFNGTDTVRAGTHLVGSGTQSATIKYDLPGGIEEINAPSLRKTLGSTNKR